MLEKQVVEYTIHSGADMSLEAEQRFLKIESCEVFYFKPAEGNGSEDRPTYAVAITAILDGKRYCAIRNGFIRSKVGKVPMLNRSMVESAATAIAGSLINFCGADREVKKELYKKRDEACRRAFEENIEELDYTYQDNLSETDLQEKAKARMRPFRLAVSDLLRLVWSSPWAEASCLDKLEVRRETYLNEVFYSIEDYFVYPLPEKPVVYGKEINEYEDFSDLKLLKKNGTKGFLFYYYALGFGLSATRLSKFSLIAEDKNRNEMLYSWSTSQLSSIVSHAFCVDKEATRQILSSEGLPVPAGRSFEAGDVDSALAYAELIGFPVVCKPLNGSKGEGVVVNIKNQSELKSAISTLGRSVYRDSEFIVEKFIKGKDYRIVVVGDEVKGALCRELASVTGDGVHSTAELMLAKHAWRMRNPHFIDRSAFIEEDDAFGNINNFSVDLMRVPEVGEHVVFGTSCNLSQGADSVDVLDELHPSIKQAAVKATLAIPGLRYCGVDILIEDHSKHIEEQSAAIIELNAKAAIGNCEYPMFGKSREVVKHIFLQVAKDYDVELCEKFNDGKCKILCEVRGGVKEDDYRQWLNKIERQLGLSVKVKKFMPRKIFLEVEGGVKGSAMLATRLIVGPRTAKTTSVKTRVIS